MAAHFSMAMAKFAADLAVDLPLPQKKFTRSFLPALEAAGSLKLTDVAEQLQGSPLIKNSREYKTRAQFLSRALARSNLNVGKMAQRYWEKCRPVLNENDGKGVNIAVDGGDCVKPHGRPDAPRGMQGLSNVRDGSKSTKKEPKLAMGIASVSIEASLPNGNQLPLWHGPYSTHLADTVFGTEVCGEHANHKAAIERVAPYAGKRAWWSFDRGYGNYDYMDFFDEIGIRWLVRIPAEGGAGERWVTMVGGVPMHLSELIHTVKSTFTLQVVKRKATLNIKMGLLHVQLGGGRVALRPGVRTLLVAWINDAPTPVVLLAGEKLELNQETAELMRIEYLRRWRVEESHRLMKDRDGFGGSIEGFHVMRFVCIQRIQLFWMFTQGYIALERERHSCTGMRLLRLAVEACMRKDEHWDIRGQLNKLIASKIKAWLPAFFRRVYPPRVRVKAAASKEERTAAVEARLKQLGKDERKAERERARREEERERLRRKLELL